MLAFQMLALQAASLNLPRRLTVQSSAAIAIWRMSSAAADASTESLPKTGGKMMLCDEDLMAPKAHGTTQTPVQQNLRWDVDRKNADRICSFNRHYAEYAGCERSPP